MSINNEKYYRSSSYDADSFNEIEGRYASPDSYAQSLNSYVEFRKEKSREYKRSASVFSSRHISSKKSKNYEYERSLTPERHEDYEKRKRPRSPKSPEAEMPQKIRKRRTSRWEEQASEYLHQERDKQTNSKYPPQQYRPSYYETALGFSGSGVIPPSLWENIKSTPPPPSAPPPRTPPEPPLPPENNYRNDRYAPYENHSYRSQNRDQTNDSYWSHKNGKYHCFLLCKMKWCNLFSINFLENDACHWKKQRNRTVMVRYPTPKDTPEHLIDMVLKAEQDLRNTKVDETSLLIKFPDPHINKELVKGFSEDISAVHFHQNIAPRYCYVFLKNTADVSETIKKISQIPFGCGNLSAEISVSNPKLYEDESRNLDPFTLYVGNLSTHLHAKTLKNCFPEAQRIDIGYAQRMKFTKYAFIRFGAVETAIEAYKRMVYKEIDGRQIILRFKRNPNEYGMVYGKNMANNGNGPMSNEFETNEQQLKSAENQRATNSAENNKNENQNKRKTAVDRESTPDWDADEDLGIFFHKN